MSKREEALENWQSEFPLKESFPTMDGRTVEFFISGIETGTGFTLEARETAESSGRRLGYSLRAFSPGSPWLALGELRGKIRKRLSTRYTRRDHLGIHLTHDRIEAMVDYSDEQDGVVLQVDGEAIGRDDLWTLLSTYEGFEVTIEISGV